MRRRLGSWRQIEHLKSDLMQIGLYRYDVPIVKPWRVKAVRINNQSWGPVAMHWFDNCYFTEAKARRALVDKERHLIVTAALEALGIS